MLQQNLGIPFVCVCLATFVIMLGGIIVNVILAWLIFTIMYATVGQKFIATEKFKENIGLAFGEVGQKDLGFRNGDKILSVDGKHQPSLTD